MIGFLKAIYFNNRLYLFLGACSLFFVAGAYSDMVFALARVFLMVLIIAAVSDIVILFARRKAVSCERTIPERLSNGDENTVSLTIRNNYGFKTKLEIIDEIPFQFQKRDFHITGKLEGGGDTRLNYTLRPVERGEYSFGSINVFAESPLGLARRKFKQRSSATVPVYPSFIKMKEYELLAISNRLRDTGVKQIRKIGHTMEFEQIRQYIRGDDYRTINWKATARKNDLMVNQYQDERSQPVYSVIDMGRAMKMPFAGMSLLDYSINTSLVISKIALMKHDKPGLITFSDKIDTLLPATRKKSQIRSVMEALYNQETRYPEPNYELLYATIRRRINRRSLILLYTNFETLSGMQRNLDLLRAISKYHLLVVIFFRNTELYQLFDIRAANIKDVYSKVVAEKIDYEKRNIVRELGRYGIHSIYTAPEELSVNTINKYLEIKARRLL